jgi:hypothetical protein
LRLDEEAFVQNSQRAEQLSKSPELLTLKS